MATQPGGEAPAARTSGVWLPDAEFDRGVPQLEARWRDRLRWDPGRRGAIALGVLVILVIAATGWWLAAARPREVPLTQQSPMPPAVSGSASVAPLSSAATAVVQPASVTSSARATLIVDVAGKVHRPGIYELPPGSRVFDALRAAGGPRRGVSTVSLNLAEPLRDGEQIVVGGPAPVGPVPMATTGSSAAPAPVDLNTATLEQLETLPGIGPVLGQHILDWRAANGQFTSVDQLRDVSGIGDVRFAQLSPLVTL